MNLQNLIHVLESFCANEEENKIVLSIAGTEHPIRHIADYNGVTITTFPETDTSIMFTPHETLSCLKSLTYPNGKRNPLDEDVAVCVGKNEYADLGACALTIESVGLEEGTITIRCRYIEPGDTFLIEYTEDYSPPYYVAGIVQTVLHPFTEDEEIILEKAYYADCKGFIDVESDEPLIQEPYTFYVGQRVGHIERHFTGDEWDSLQDDIQTYLILKEKLPFAKEYLLVEILESLKQQKKSYVNIF